MTKKVGLITFHDTANHGAALQMYATYKVIESFGYKPIVIDYSNTSRANIYNPLSRLKSEFRSRRFLAALKTCLGFRTIQKRIRAFDEFYRKHTVRTVASYTELSDLTPLNDEFFKFVSGSDQIWSLKNNGKDLNYLLSFVTNSDKKTSYASSLGMSEIPAEFEERYRESLSTFSYLSVREATGAKILSKILERDVKVVLDPVFLLSSDEWLRLAGGAELKNHVSSGHLLFDYSAQQNVLDEFLSIPSVGEQFAKIEKFGTNLKLKDIVDPKTKTYPSSGPMSFIQHIANSSFVHTTSFHGTVLAIIFSKKFIVRLSGNSGRDSRIIDLLSSLNLDGRIYKKGMTSADVFEDIDYDSVHEKLGRLKSESLDFFMRSLDVNS